MANYELRSDEAVILRSRQIRWVGGRRGGSDELILTNHNLIVVDKGILGRPEAEYIRLDQVKVVDGRPQALVTKARDGRQHLEVFMIDRTEVFVLESGGRREAVKWANAIAAAVNGKGMKVQDRTTMALPGTGLVVETLRDTVGQVAKSLWKK
jgi:hypothetical protein